MAVKRIIVKVPIEPSDLNQFSPGSLHMPLVETVWAEGGKKWKSSFLIWKNHGYTNDDNLIIGYLDLEQKQTSGNLVELSFFEKRIHAGGRENIVEGSLIADSSKMFAPVKWELSSSFIAPDGAVVPGLNFNQKAVVESDRIILYNNGKRMNVDNQEKIQHEFALIRSLYDPGFSPSRIGSFLFLENGLISKSGHHLALAPEINQTLEGRKLKCILQTGYGINPIEYYLDENNLLVAAISCFNAKIYNPDAAEIYKDFSKISRKKGSSEE